MAKKLPVTDRIIAAFGKDDYQLTYHQLLHRVFPPEEYPRAYRYSCNGGPPGVAMPFRKALNALNMNERFDEMGTRIFSKPYAQIHARTESQP